MLEKNTCSSASFSNNAFLNRQLLVLTSRKRCSSSQTDESRRSFDIGRSVARIRLSTAPCGFRLISTSYKKITNQHEKQCITFKYFGTYECANDVKLR